MNARLYDPVIGRFFSTDHLIKYFEATQSLNRYSYCQNNPVNSVDLDGMPDNECDDDYFSKNVKYLGHDDTKTDNLGL